MKKFLEVVGNGTQYVLTMAQTNEVFQLVELILSIATTLFILGINIYSWWKKAKKDGKITEEEVKEGVEIITNGVKEIQDHLNNKKEGDK